jgi:hypothetical protein
MVEKTAHDLPPLTLRVLPGSFAVCRLPAEATLPSDVTEEPFFSITRTAEELSLVCRSGAVPLDSAGRMQVEAGWRMLKVEGPLDFALTGVLATLTAALAHRGISVCALSTFDTDYLLVKEDRMEAALEALKASLAVGDVRWDES